MKARFTIGFLYEQGGARVDTSVRDCQHLPRARSVARGFRRCGRCDPRAADARIGVGSAVRGKKRNRDGLLWRRRLLQAPRRRAARGRTEHDSVRALTLVYYFHASPKRFEGGELRLYARDGFVDLAPVCDRLVAFPSASSHEVRPTRCDSALCRWEIFDQLLGAAAAPRTISRAIRLRRSRSDRLEARGRALEDGADGFRVLRDGGCAASSG